MFRSVADISQFTGTSLATYKSHAGVITRYVQPLKVIQSEAVKEILNFPHLYLFVDLYKSNNIPKTEQIITIKTTLYTHISNEWKN